MSRQPRTTPRFEMRAVAGILPTMIDVDRLTARLAALELSPNAASQKAGLGRDYIRDIIRGRIKDPSALRLRRLADVLGCSPAFLLGLDDDEKDWVQAIERVDDRNKQRLDQIVRDIKSSGDNSSVESYLDMLDSVDEKTLLELTYNWISDFIYDALYENLQITDNEKKVLLGTKGLPMLGDFERRMILSKVFGVVNDAQYYRSLSIAKAWEIAEAGSTVDVFSVAEVKNQLSGFLKSFKLLPSSPAEVLRIAITAFIARFLVADDPSAGRAATLPRADDPPEL